MRFTAMYVATVASEAEATGTRATELYEEFAASEQAGEGLIDRWLDQHFGQIVYCRICGNKARVLPNQDDDMVVTITNLGGEIIACDDCLGALTLAATMSMDREMATELLGRMTSEFAERVRTEAQTSTTKRLAGLVALEQAADRLTAPQEASTSERRSSDPRADITRWAEGLTFDA